jgi:hypothetical protein
MLATTLRRAAAPKRVLSQLQSQRRHGGSLSKNKHIEVRVAAPDGAVAVLYEEIHFSKKMLTTDVLLLAMHRCRTGTTGEETRRSASSSTASSSRLWQPGASSLSASATSWAPTSAYVNAIDCVLLFRRPRPVIH